MLNLQKKSKKKKYIKKPAPARTRSGGALSFFGSMVSSQNNYDEDDGSDIEEIIVESPSEEESDEGDSSEFDDFDLTEEDSFYDLLWLKIIPQKEFPDIVKFNVSSNVVNAFPRILRFIKKQVTYFFNKKVKKATNEPIKIDLFDPALGGDLKKREIVDSLKLENIMGMIIGKEHVGVYSKM